MLKEKTATRLRYLMLSRVAIVTLLLGIAIFMKIKGEEYLPEISLRSLSWLIITSYILSLLYFFLPRLVRSVQTNVYVKAIGDVVLEVGGGSGYQAAVLAKLARAVHTVEIVPALARACRERLARLGFANVHVHAGDGGAGLEAEAPFDAIVVTAAARRVPPALVRQLAPGGRLAIPLGEEGAPQELVLLAKDARGEVSLRPVLPVRFVPLTGRGQGVS